MFKPNFSPEYKPPFIRGKYESYTKPQWQKIQKLRSQIYNIELSIKKIDEDIAYIQSGKAAEMEKVVPDYLKIAYNPNIIVMGGPPKGI